MRDERFRLEILLVFTSDESIRLEIFPVFTGDEFRLKVMIITASTQISVFKFYKRISD